MKGRKNKKNFREGLEMLSIYLENILFLLDDGEVRDSENHSNDRRRSV